MDSNNYRYNVEEILDKRIIDGSIEYFIKWEGYSFNESTWEILDDGFNKNMLETFERNRFETIKGPNSTSLLKRIFSISSATISRAVRALIPLMIPCLYIISLELMNLNCLHYVDCTDFRINRVHPYQFEWYRGDLKYHYFTIQILVDENGTIDSAIIGKGHNNDSGMSMLTGLNDLIYSFIKNGEEFAVLADPAYNGTLFYTPKRIKNLLGKGDEILSNQERKVVESRFHHFQAGKRSLVENKFADMKNRWGIVKQRGIHQPNFLSYCLIMIFHIEQINFNLRNNK
ncbi:hypothetical protein RB653_004935 [Dictyostelium firmibasis]|uniref:Chromo domain-containing protein n=1 Tax=Dictyostelium firmibasis TaxID=79012 RepID=A0AAN7U6Q9_9MYCE